jgi:tetratricopeptide (TPR) repeat protein
VLFLTPHDIRNIKEVGKVCHSLCIFAARIIVFQCYYLLGKHRLAIDVYNQAQKMGFDDWELCHSKGLCYFQLGDMAEALKSFKRANILQVPCFCNARRRRNRILE